MTVSEVAGVASLIFSVVAAIGVWWQIFRIEQLFPLAGMMVFIADKGAKAYIALEHGKPRETYPLRDVEIRHYGDGNLWDIQISAIYGRIMDGSEQYRPFMGPGAEPMKLAIGLNPEYGGLIEVTAYNSFRAGNRQWFKKLGIRRLRVDCDTWTLFHRRWWKWRPLKEGDAPDRLGEHEKPDPGLPPGVRLLGQSEEA